MTFLWLAKRFSAAFFRAALAAALLSLPMMPMALAQVTQSAKPERPDQTIQRIRTEDAGTRIDEVRVGGQTQSITVQPKTGDNTPAYEVKLPDSAKGNAPSALNGDTNGSRVWNVLKF